MQKITLTQPDDWHLHLRDGIYLNTTVAAAARIFSRAIVMPNLSPPVTNTALASAYFNRIHAAIPHNSKFQPLMSLYLTDNTTSGIIKEAKESGIIYACKLYPAGATTHSDNGVTRIENLYNVFASMEELALPLLLHGEVIDPEIDIFDREKYFIERYLLKLIENFPHLRIVLEHITTTEAVDFIYHSPPNIAATITAHHLLLNRNDIFKQGINPHHYCLPILKRNSHQQALVKAATSGHPKFFLGTDSAPHARQTKECAHGCAGIYTSPAAIELYAQIFHTMNAIQKLENFASFNGADFYKLPRNQTTITLVQKKWRMPDTMNYGEDLIIPFMAGKEIEWTLETLVSDVF